MGASFVVTLREGFEAALLLGIVYSYLDRIGARADYRWVTAGAVLGGLLSVAFGVLITLVSGPLLDLGPDLVGALVILVAVVVLTWHGWWMRQHARAIKGEVQRRIDEARATRRLWVVAVIAFTGVFREGAETVLFLWGLMNQATVAGGGGAAGAVLGLGTAAALGWAVFRGGRQLSLQRFFTGTSLVLVLVAGGLFSTAVGKLDALGFLPASPTLWDTSALLDDTSVVGSVLAGLTGYRARPSLLEVTAYVVYLLVVGLLIFGRSGQWIRSRNDRARRESAGVLEA